MCSSRRVVANTGDEKLRKGWMMIRYDLRQYRVIVERARRGGYIESDRGRRRCPLKSKVWERGVVRLCAMPIRSDETSLIAALQVQDRLGVICLGVDGE